MCDLGQTLGLEAQPPSTGAVGRDYLQLVNAYAAGAPTAFGTEAAYKPAYQALDQNNLERWLAGGPAETINTPYQAPVGRGQWYNPDTGEIRGSKAPGFVKATEPTTVNRTATAQLPATRGWLSLFSDEVAPTLERVTSQARAADIGDVNNLGPGAYRAVGAVNPQQTGLIGELGQSAAEQLAAGTQVLPSESRRISQQVRSDWANRGLGDSAPAQLDEALQFYGAGQNALQARQAAASNAIGQEEYLTGPALGIATGAGSAVPQAAGVLGESQQGAGSAGPSIIPTGQSYDIFNTAYNARAAAKIGTANNQAAVLGSALSY